MLSLLPWPFGTQPPRCTCTRNYAHKPNCPLYEQEKSAGEEEAEDTVAALLARYTPSGACPPSARIDPALSERIRRGPRISISDLWYVGMFVATKAADLTTDFVSHHIWGPRKRSWGIEMTLISSFMRNVGRHTRLTDITMLRLLMQIGALVPPPPDALVTPVSFRVQSRHLRGLLAPFDELEYGGTRSAGSEPSASQEPRELSGEWVVGKALWTRLNRQWLQNKKLNGLSADHRIPERVVLYLHGGAYYVFNAATHRLITIPLSKYADARVFAVNYRLAPETRFPGALHDAVHAYRRLTDELHVPPSRIIVAGDSAGGGLTLALLMYLRDEGYELPSGAILFSPWVDLTMSCDSWDSNAAYDVVPRPDADDPLNPVACYLGWGDGMKQYVTHPYASPLFGDFKGLPPMLVQSGEAEVLRDEIMLLAHKATLAGVDVRHELFEDAVHVFQMFPFLPATRRAFQNVRSFVKELDDKLSAVHTPDSQPQSDAVADEMETNADGASVVRGDGLEVASGRMAGLELANEGEKEIEGEKQQDRPTQDNMNISVTGLGLDFGTPQSESQARPSTSSPRRHNRGLTSPLMRMTPASPTSQPLQLPASPPRSLSSSWIAPSSVNPTPPPSVRVRSRVLSHPDIADLCASFAARPGMARTTTFTAQGEDDT
ncbi:carbohydrate esterase family 10 protein [Ceratobasidium sp. AG-Ba]|nr:carbohydrate esterase family 10 protein [Ceratobasidium sp. AG-Ba]QRW09200.1 carbohydrate esterase family 10 protein [Ceratobasidium sp. AG-Ba]